MISPGVGDRWRGMNRRILLASTAAFLATGRALAQEPPPIVPDPAPGAPRTLDAILEQAGDLESLKAVIVARKAGREAAEAFDLRLDPAQRRNRLASFEESREPEHRIRMLLDEAFAEMEKGALPRESRAFDEETKRALEAIGYGGK